MRLLSRLQAAIVAPDLRATPKRVERWLTRGPQLDAWARLDVYRTSYVARLEECLADDYPALRFALGAEAFSELCRGYVECHPPGEPSLNHYGRRLSLYCEQRFAHAPLGNFSAELAAFEWMLVEAVHAPDTPRASYRSLRALAELAEPRDTEELAEPRDTEERGEFGDPGAAGELNAQRAAGELGASRLVFNPSLCVRLFSHPVPEFYRCWASGGPGVVPEPASPSPVAVWRSGYRVLRVALSVPSFALLEALLAGESVAAAVERLAARGLLSSVAAEEVNAWFAGWVADGLIAGIS